MQPVACVDLSFFWGLGGLHGCCKHLKFNLESGVGRDCIHTVPFFNSSWPVRTSTQHGGCFLAVRTPQYAPFGSLSNHNQE